MTDSTGAPPFECAAFPRLLRVLSIVLMLALVGAAMTVSIELRRATRTAQGLALFGLAWLCIAWVGYWLLHSRTRIDGDELRQTWLWTKQVRAPDVANMKLVHWSWLEAVIAPRLLVRQRNGAIVWFQAEDARVLRAFMDRVAERRLNPQPE